MGFLFGIVGFLLLFLSDCNDARPFSSGIMKCCFPAGFVLLAIGTLWDCRAGQVWIGGGMRIVILVAAAAFLVLEIYTLFFALSVREAYSSPGTKRPVNKKGVYALCRHPGVLWFIGFYACLCAGAGFPVRTMFLYDALDVILVLFEDRYVFPVCLEGYTAYQTETPFLLPNAKSIRACFGAGR